MTVYQLSSINTCNTSRFRRGEDFLQTSLSENLYVCQLSTLCKRCSLSSIMYSDSFVIKHDRNPRENRNDRNDLYLIPTIISVTPVQSDSNMVHNMPLAKRYTIQCECT